MNSNHSGFLSISCWSNLIILPCELIASYESLFLFNLNTVPAVVSGKFFISIYRLSIHTIPPIYIHQFKNSFLQFHQLYISFAYRATFAKIYDLFMFPLTDFHSQTNSKYHSSHQISSISFFLIVSGLSSAIICEHPVNNMTTVSSVFI